MSKYINTNLHFRALHFFGVWPYKNSGIIYYMYMLFTLIGTIFMLISMIYFTHLAPDFQEKLLGIIVCTSLSDVSWKSWYSFLNRKKINLVIEDLEITYEKFAKDFQEEKENIFKRIHLITIIRTISQVILSNLSGFFWISKYVIMDADEETLSLQLIKVPGLKKAFGLGMWYPFEMNSVSRFIFGYVVQVFLGTWICTNFGIVDLLFISLNEYLRGHFNILSYYLKSLNPNDPQVKSKLADCLRYHDHLFWISEKIGELFGPQAFTQYGCFTFLFSFLGFSLLNNMGAGFYFVIYITLLLTEIFMTSLTCDGVYQESLEIANSAYFCCWPEIKDKSFRTGIQLCILRAQMKPVLYRAMFIIVINLETFTRVVNSSFSYIAILQNIA